MPLLKSEKAANAKTCLNQNKQGGGKECSRQGTKGGGHDAARRSKEGLIQVSECNLDEGDPFFDSCSRCSFALMQWVKLQDFAVLRQCRMTRNATCALCVGASETRVGKCKLPSWLSASCITRTTSLAPHPSYRQVPTLAIDHEPRRCQTSER